MANGEGAGPVHTDERLKEVAREHLRYELLMLVEQVELWERWQGPPDAQYDALIEASLVHLRVVNDFLCKQPTKDDIAAVHYAPRWHREHHEVLSHEERDSLNAQLFHLAARREERWGAQLRRLVGRACLEFCEFMAHVDDEDMRQALAQAHLAAIRGLPATS